MVSRPAAATTCALTPIISRWLCAAALSVAGLAVVVPSTWSNEGSGTATRRSAAAIVDPPPASAAGPMHTDPMHEVTPEREAAAETFARLHHPELAELLARLRTADPQAFQNAIRDLFRESERLAKLKGRDSARYELELQAWKVSSRIRLATARLAMADSDSLRLELAQLVGEKHAIQEQLLQAERDKLAARIQKLDADLAELAASRTARIEQDVERLLRAARARMTVNPAPKTGRPETPAATPTSTPTPKNSPRSRP